MTYNETYTELPALISRWKEKLKYWARNGTLEKAAQFALNLPDGHAGLNAFVSLIGAQDFSPLPAVVPLGWDAMEGSACAYAPERGLVLINVD